MPPRYVYWTILIDQQPTAFRAKSQEDLLPTLHQLRRTNKDVVMKWFARGRLWESPEAEREAQHKPRVTEKRGTDWRPGGQHKDPRARFEGRGRKEQSSASPHRAAKSPFRSGSGPGDPQAPRSRPSKPGRFRSAPRPSRPQGPPRHRRK